MNISNATPDNAIAKTASARKRLVSFILVAMLIGAAAVTLIATQRRDTTLRAAGQTILLERATSQVQHQKGLSGRALLPHNQGMLFVFEQDKASCFWMKDMQFSIDMVWLDRNKKVVDVRTNVSPSSYPGSFCPEKPATYVIELNAGKAKELGITTGVTLTF